MREYWIVPIIVSILILGLGLSEQSFAKSEKQVTTTDVGTYDVTLKTNPPSPQIGEETYLFVEVISKKIRQAQEHVDYQMFILHDGNEVFSSGVQHTHTGTASASYTFDFPGEYVVAILIDGILFKPIPLEAAGFTLAIGDMAESPEVTKESEPEESSSETLIPDWIRNNAKWWSDGAIGDSDFALGIEFMIKENVISIPDLPEQVSEATDEGVPDWIKNNAGWWADGIISDGEFISGIKYLAEQGIIKVQVAKERVVSTFYIEENHYPVYQFSLTPTSPDCPDSHLHTSSGYTVDGALV